MIDSIFPLQAFLSSYLITRNSKREGDQPLLNLTIPEKIVKKTKIENQVHDTELMQSLINDTKLATCVVEMKPVELRMSNGNRPTDIMSMSDK